MSEKKSNYKGNTDARRRATNKYHKDTIENITIHVPKGRKDHYKSAADQSGMSLNQFAINSMDEKIERDRLDDV